MPQITPQQAQWIWLVVVLATITFYVGLDVFMVINYGPDTTFSRCHSRLISKYPAFFVAIPAIVFFYFGHVGTPCN